MTVALRADISVSTPRRRAPRVTLAVVALNLAMFGLTLAQGADAGAFLDRFGLVPRELLGGWGAEGAVWLSPFTAMFLHGGWLHLVGNAVYLWIFGPSLEERLGPARFAAFYLGCGLVAAAIHVASDPSGFVATVGASGAVAGLLGAYASQPDRAWRRLVWPAVRVPVSALLWLWVAVQSVSVLSNLGSGEASVASWAHLGGFLAGFQGARWPGLAASAGSAPRS